MQYAVNLDDQGEDIGVGGGEGGKNVRKFKGKMNTVIKLYCIVFSIYMLLYLSGVLMRLGIWILPARHDAIVLGFIFSLLFILYPATKKSPVNRIPWYDWILIGLSLAVNLYMVINIQRILVTNAAPILIELIFGTILVLLILEAVRRAVHWVLTVLGLIFITYPLICEYLPGWLSSRAFGYSRLIEVVYMTQHGVYGSTLHTMSTIIMAFMIFGAFLHATGAGRTFISIALSLVGRFRGGPAKAAVVASGLFGMISGSSNANVATTGVITIPLMKRIGYKPTFAGAVEAVASNGGPITPPVMGAIIFVMMDMVGATYVEVMLASMIPALLYYLALLFMVDFEAAKTGLFGLPRDQIPRVWSTLRYDWVYIIPMALLLFLMIGLHYTPETSVMYSLAVLCVVSFLGRKEDRMSWKTLTKALDKAPRNLPMIGSAVSIAGLLMAPLFITGIGIKLISVFVEFSGGNTLLLLILCAVMAFILGLPLPALAAYILLAILLAPALIMAGVLPMAAHLFCVYWGLSALITPPVGGAFMLGATIAGAPIMATGWQACRLGIVVYIMPFMFVYSPELLMIGNPVDIILTIITALIGIYMLASGLEGYFMKSMNWFQRTMLILAALAMIPNHWLGDIIGIGVGVLILGPQLLRRKPRVVTVTDNSATS